MARLSNTLANGALTKLAIASYMNGNQASSLKVPRNDADYILLPEQTTS